MQVSGVLGGCFFGMNFFFDFLALKRALKRLVFGRKLEAPPTSINKKSSISSPWGV